MSTITVHTASLTGSDLPLANALRPSLWARLREDLAVRREVRSFERAILFASPNEYGDLLAIRRRD